VRTAVDSSVLLDVIVDDPRHAAASEAALRRAAREGALVVGECVLAEIRPALSPSELDDLMDDWRLAFVPSTRDSSALAGEMFGQYLRRRAGPRRRVVADFLIGAHALMLADRLLARDRGFYRDYFNGLVILEPRDAEP